jgi:hypothetical protein
LTSTRLDGGDDDGLADNVFLALAAQPPAAAPGASAPATIGSPTPPPPRPGVAVDVQAGTGTTLVKLPGTSGFALLRGGDQIPVGATVDVRHGSVGLTSAEGRASFRGGIFTVREPRLPGAARITNLVLTGGDFTLCPTKRTRRTAGATAGPRTVVRRLFGSGKGRFRTSGRFAAATVRGTIWKVYDRCDGTYVEVERGVVAVRDLRRRRTVRVAAGHDYLASR